MSTGKFQQSLKQQAGLSLIEVMVSVAILGTVTMGAVALGDAVANQARMNRVANNIFQVFESVRAGTLMEESCTLYLQSPGGGALNYVHNQANNDGVKASEINGLKIGFLIPGVDGVAPVLVDDAGNNQLPDLGLEVNSLQLTNSMHIASYTEGDPPENRERYLAFVELELGRPGPMAAVIGGSGLFRKRIVTGLYLEVDAPAPNAPGPVVGCRSASSSMNQQTLCEGLGAKWTWNAVLEVCEGGAPPLQCGPGQVLYKIENNAVTCRDIGIDDQGCTATDAFIVELGVEHIKCDVPPVEVTEDTPPPPGGPPAPAPAPAPPPGAGCTVTAGVTSWTDDGGAPGTCFPDTSAVIPVGGIQSFNDTNANPSTGNVDFQCLAVGNLVPDTGTNSCSNPPPTSDTWSGLHCDPVPIGTHPVCSGAAQLDGATCAPLGSKCRDLELENGFRTALGCGQPNQVHKECTGHAGPITHVWREQGSCCAPSGDYGVTACLPLAGYAQAPPNSIGAPCVNGSPGRRSGTYTGFPGSTCTYAINCVPQ